MPSIFSSGKSGAAKPAPKPAAKPAPASDSPMAGVYAFLAFFSTSSPGCAMLAWILLMIFGTYLILAIPDDLTEPFAMPTPVPMVVSMADVEPHASCASYYTIQSGDTLAGISQKTGVAEYAIVYANPPAQIALPEGNTLCIPNPASIPTPAPPLVIDSQWVEANAANANGVHLPVTGLRGTRHSPAAPVQRVSAQPGWYLPLIRR